ncbi:TonB-dependent receptor [soil metagenome]
MKTNLLDLMKNILALVLCGLISSLFASFVEAQNSTGFIVGQVSERSTGRPIAGVRIYVKDKGETRSDGDGNYRLEIEPGVYDVRIDEKGFAPIIKNQVGVTGRRDTVLTIELDVTISENVEVRSEIFTVSSDQAVSNVTLRREDLGTTPGSGGDSLRAINSQPGVTATSTEFADLIVRGGTANENLTFIDNIPIHDFTYFTDQYDGSRGGRASILPPDTFDRAEFSAGGFGARYGDKMSSALDISIREANRRRVQGVFFSDSGTAGGSLDVPLGKRGSWLVSGRRSYIDVALAVAGIADLGFIGYPRTLDFTNKVVYDVTPQDKLTFTALNFFETFDQTNQQAININRRTDRFLMRRTSQRGVFGATLSSTINSKALIQSTLWTNVNHNDGTFYLPSTTFLQRRRDLRDSQTGWKEDVSLTLSPKTQFSFGGGIYIDRANYYLFENTATLYSPFEEEYTAARRENRMRLDGKTSGDLYGQATIHPTSRLLITPGVRLDHYGLTGETFASPRFAARLNATGKLSFTFAAGQYRQPPDLFLLSRTVANRNLKSQTATHVVGGAEFLVREDTRVRFEAYSKTYKDLIVQPIGPTPAFVSNGNYANTGRGTSSGFELSVQKALAGYFGGQASYGYIKSTRSLTPGGVEFSSDYERPHQLTLIGISGFYGFVVAAKYRVSSGLPYTRRTSVLTATGSSRFIQRILAAADINALRLSTFANLDIRAERRFNFKRLSISPYIDYFNITNHKSIVQPNYEFTRRTPQLFSEDKRFPIFGFRLEM